MLWKVGHIMYRINSEQFSQTLLQFIGCVLTKQNNEHYRYSTKISFDSGFLRETEGYKRDVWGQAQNILQANSWSKSNLWKYNIAQRLLSCINIKTDSGEKQNLLNWHDIEYFKDVLSRHPKKLKLLSIKYIEAMKTSGLLMMPYHYLETDIHWIGRASCRERV